MLQILGIRNTNLKPANLHFNSLNSLNLLSLNHHLLKFNRWMWRQ